MRERPILFSTPMVQAVLDGRKTMTRRVVKPQPENGSIPMLGDKFPVPLTEPQIIAECCCPYGKVGDRLWVRETTGINMHPHSRDFGQRIYKATQKVDPDYPIRWIPSIHMKREASRINLEITGVRVERLQEITEADARDEGVGDEDAVMRVDSDILPTARLLGEPFENDRVWFAHLWNELNGKRGFGWDVNPWVWIIEFKRI